MTLMKQICGRLALLCAVVAVVVGNLPLFLLPPKGAMLYPAVAALLFAVAWAALSAADQRGIARVDLDKPDTPRAALPNSAWPVRVGLAIVVGLGSGAALIQMIGPDGEYGRRVAEVREAGGGRHTLPIDTVVGTARRTGTSINEQDQYAATVTVTVPFTDGPRSVTVPGVRTLDPPARGRAAHLVYAAGHPELGVHDDPFGFFDTTFPMIFIWAFTGILTLVLAGGLTTANTGRLRVFHPRVHLPAMLILGAGGALLLPLVLGHPDGWTDVLLAIPAAAAPWAAAAWVIVKLVRLHGADTVFAPARFDA
ncbi:hypothetical protein ACFZBU_45610 [Embleya sp. NPDC008237]|uniref:hypothetical protein n=1 Tax=Embleya sp. NPDC008237 TaxID=3363978 RepID=UPI0036EE3B2B